MVRKEKSLIWAALAAVLLFGTAENINRFITDYLWFSEMGYTGTFLTRLTAGLRLGVPVFFAASGVFYLYLGALRKRYVELTGLLPDKDELRKAQQAVRGGALLLGLVYSLIFASGLWFDFLSFFNRTSFGKADPLFGNDVSFYFFVLPLMRGLLSMGLTLLFILGALTVGFMLLLSGQRPKSNPDHVYDLNDFRRRHDIRSLLNRNIFAGAMVKIGILGALALLLIALTNVISVYDLLYSPRGAAFGASYTDVTVSMPGYWILAAVALGGAGFFLYGAFKRQWRFMAVGPVLLIAVALVISMAEVAVQRFVVNPDERAKERPYIAYNIEGTREAFGLKDIEIYEYPAEDTLQASDLADNADIIRNIRINDYSPLEMTVNQLQGIRLYYEFNDVDVDRYTIDGAYRQVFIAAREMNQEKLEQKTWVNNHLQFTHGYGVALAPVNEVTPEGQPVLMVKNIPPVSLTPDLTVTRPEIYFGEYTDNYIIVNAREKEFDYPKGSDNVYTTYEGPAGIRLSPLNRLLFSLREKTVNPLISNALTGDSRIILNRNVLDRVKTIMPWLTYEDDPYIVINQEDGRLFWIIDAYTASSLYPYSQPHGSGINYIRNSVKVTVDAYTGETRYYLFDQQDPVATTYSRIFPDLFRPASEMPQGLAGHVRYPRGLLNIQADIYKKFHVTNPDVFYNGEDIWDIAQEKYLQEQGRVQANYVMFRLPGEDAVEFILNIPFTPKDKSNMNALLMARNDGEHYGKLFMYSFPKDKLVQGPQMVESRIDQDTAISQQLTFWDQKGSAVLRGNLMTIPIKNSLLYVEPIYLRSSGERSLPEMKRVIVSYNDRVVMEETLAKALDRIFGTESPTEASAEGGAPAVAQEARALVEQARGLIESSVDSIRQLQEIVEQLNGIINSVEAPAPEAAPPAQ